jgi:ArsR family transcriptional regulator
MQKVFKALSSRPRIRILQLIDDMGRNRKNTDCCEPEEVCVCKITARMRLAPSTISHHLNLLKDAGLIKDRREGTWIYYSLDREKLAEAAGWLFDFGSRESEKKSLCNKKTG